MIAEEAPPIAEADFIDHVVDRPEDVIGEVDAVIISTDDGSDHVRRARPFVEAGLPVFVDKPLADNLEDLAWFVAARERGARILSSSALRYAPEVLDLRERRSELGELRWVSSFTAKTWERYGIHALEAAYGITGPGLPLGADGGLEGGDVVTLGHEAGCRSLCRRSTTPMGPSGSSRPVERPGTKSLHFTRTYAAFRAQLVAFIDALQSGEDPFPFEQTIEQMLVIIAGRESRAQGGRRVEIAALRERLMEQGRGDELGVVAAGAQPPTIEGVRPVIVYFRPNRKPIVIALTQWHQDKDLSGQTPVLPPKGSKRYRGRTAIDILNHRTDVPSSTH